MTRANLLAPLSLLICLIATPVAAQDTPSDAPVAPEAPATTEEQPTVQPDAAAPETTAEVVAEPTEEVVEPTPEATETVEKAATPATPAPPATTSIKRTESDVAVGWNEGLDEFQRRYRWKFQIDGYIRTQYSGIQNDPDNETYGRNDGFILANARIGFGGRMRDSLGFRLQLDGAVDRAISDAETPVFEVDTRVRDAYLWWEPTRFSRLSFGQFKPKYDVEELFSRDELLFVDRSVGSRGVRNIEGFNVRGMSRDREPGIELGMRPLYFGADRDKAEGFGVAYALSMTNGQSSNYSLNDNEEFAYYGRLQVHYGDMVRLGGAAFTNTAVIGQELADRVEVDQFGWTTDLTLKWTGLTVIGSLTSQTESFAEIEREADNQAMAYQVQIAYREPFFGFQPTFRFASYDPTAKVTDEDGNEVADPIFDNDARTFYTVGLNYNPRYPIQVLVNYTITQEEDAVALENNRFDLLFQVTW